MVVFVVAVLVLVVASTSALAGGEVNFFYGQKQLDLGVPTSGLPSELRSFLDDLE